MSTNPSTDPIPYRRDLRKKMGLEDEDSKSSNDQNESNPKNEEHME
jgi:hypothetical protein